MLPEDKHAPTCSTQLALHPAVARTIAGNLICPVARVVSWRAVTARAAVPEAAMCEYNDALFAESEIRLALQVAVPPPADNVAGAQDRRHPALGRRIAAAPDGRHVAAAALAADLVGHYLPVASSACFGNFLISHFISSS